MMLDPIIQSDLGKLMSELTTQVHKECPDGSFRRTFWDQQLRSCKVSNKKADVMASTHYKMVPAPEIYFIWLLSYTPDSGINHVT